jgi:hypothetical protein
MACRNISGLPTFPSPPACPLPLSAPATGVTNWPMPRAGYSHVAAGWIRTPLLPPPKQRLTDPTCVSGHVTSPRLPGKQPQGNTAHTPTVRMSLGAPAQAGPRGRTGLLADTRRGSSPRLLVSRDCSRPRLVSTAGARGWQPGRLWQAAWPRGTVEMGERRSKWPLWRVGVALE